MHSAFARTHNSTHNSTHARVRASKRVGVIPPLNAPPCATTLAGDTTMRNYYLVFDLAHKRIGWGPVNELACGSI